MCRNVILLSGNLSLYNSDCKHYNASFKFLSDKMKRKILILEKKKV